LPDLNGNTFYTPFFWKKTTRIQVNFHFYIPVQNNLSNTKKNKTFEDIKKILDVIWKIIKIMSQKK